MIDMAATSSEGLSGVQKAAILLIALGPEMSSKIFKHLKDEEIEQLTLEIANTRSVAPQVKNDILDENFIKNDDGTWRLVNENDDIDKEKQRKKALVL